MKFTPVKTTTANFNLDVWKSTPQRSNKKTKYIYLIAGVHGDEPEGVYVLKKLFAWLKKLSRKDLALIVIPAVNTYGLIHHQRTNKGGVDLNRNWPAKNWSPKFSKKRYYPGLRPLSEPENQNLFYLFKKFPPLFLISFHSWIPMLNFNGTEGRRYCEFLSIFNSYPVTHDMGYPTPGSLGHFLNEKFKASVVTYELPTLKDSGKSLQKIWNENKKGLFSLFRDFL